MNGLHGIIFSYEKRNDLRELTEIRSAASIPFGGRYRAVDFALSNLVNAGVTDVGVVLHGRYQSMVDHLGTGKVWDLSRKRGGLRILPPFNYQRNWGVLPFQTFLMGNRCCVNCRIFAWGSWMMATPMAFVPHWFSWSLVGLGLVVLVVWEVRFRRYPERFWFGSNKLLQCAHCQEQLCRYKFPRSPRFRG